VAVHHWGTASGGIGIVRQSLSNCNVDSSLIMPHGQHLRFAVLTCIAGARWWCLQGLRWDGSEGWLSDQRGHRQCVNCMVICCCSTQLCADAAWVYCSLFCQPTTVDDLLCTLAAHFLPHASGLWNRVVLTIVLCQSMQHVMPHWHVHSIMLVLLSLRCIIHRGLCVTIGYHTW